MEAVAEGAAVCGVALALREAQDLPEVELVEPEDARAVSLPVLNHSPQCGAGAVTRASP